MHLLRRGSTRVEFERFAEAQTDGLLRSAYLMVGDRSEAEDIVQDCLLRLARKWPRVRAMEHPGAYARQVLFSLVLDGERKRSRRRIELGVVETLPTRDGDGATTAALDTRADLLRALAELPARQRAVLVLRYFVDLPEAEVAAALNCPPGTVKSSTSRGLERLREALDSGTSTATAEDTPEKTRRTIS